MALSYKPLWKLLIDKGINKSVLHDITGLSQSTISKLSKGKNVNTEILDKLCKHLNCNIEDIVEYINEEEKN